jgi:hypothetical protein
MGHDHRHDYMNCWDVDCEHCHPKREVIVEVNLRNTNPGSGPKPRITRRTEEVTMSKLSEYKPESGWVIDSFKIGSFS